MPVIKEKTNKNGEAYFEWTKSVTIGGKRTQIKKRFPTKTMAKEELKKLEGSLSAGKYEVGNNAKFKTAVEGYLKQVRKDVVETTYINYKRIADNHLIPKLGNKKIKDIKFIQLQEFINEVSFNKEGKAISRSFAGNIKGMLLRVFHYLLLREEVEHNPARDVKIPRKLVDGEGRAFRPEEVSQLLKYLKKDRFYIAYLLGFKTGMRYGEIQGLKFSDIDFENGIIHINRQFSSTEGKIVDRLKTEKSKAALRVTTDVIEELFEWKQIVEAEKAALGSKYMDEDLVVCTPNGTPTSHVTLRAHLRKASVFLGFGHCKLHTMRHTYATVLSKKLMPQELKKYLRHKNHLVSLNTYTHDYDHIVGDEEILQDLYSDKNKAK